MRQRGPPAVTYRVRRSSSPNVTFVTALPGIGTKASRSPVGANTYTPERSPSRAEWEAEKNAESEEAPRRRVAAPAGGGSDAPRRRVAASSGGGADAPRRRVVANGSPPEDDDDLPRDILIVASKLKKYVKARSGMSTSDRVMDALSDIVRRKCDAAIRRAAEDGRKTVLDRDFE